MRSLCRNALVATWLVLAGTVVFAQTKATPKELFYDAEGKLISNNEFVDIRMANFHYPDATVVKTLEDGTVEFRLQKVAQEGMSVPLFTATTLDGKTVSMSDLRGKVVVLNFWFIGCPVCRAHHPKLNDLKAKFAAETDVVFLAMTADPPGAVNRYLSKEKFEFLQAVGAGPAMEMFKFQGFPKNIVVGRTGEIVYWRSTVRAWDKFENVIRGELAK